MEAFENKPQLGSGIYTVPDIAQVLRISTNKVGRWIRTYWDEQLGKEYDNLYSWNIDRTKGVSFHTLVELYVFYRLSEAGIKPKAALMAHKILSKRFDTLFPFANSEVLNSLNTDGSRIYLEQDQETIITLDKSNQFNFDFIKVFFKLVEFDGGTLASRFWPLGKEKSIVCDPQRQFGHAVIGNTNIYPDVILSMHKAGEPVKFIASLYEISDKQVEDAIEYCQAA